MIRQAVAALLLAGQAQAQTVVLYAHQDAPRAALLGRVASIYDDDVIDYRTQRPGNLWRQHMALQIVGAEVVLVVWSASAAASPELAEELRLAYLAAALRRPPPAIVPVLLDSTPMPPELAAHHAIDWSAPCPVSSSQP